MPEIPKLSDFEWEVMHLVWQSGLAVAPDLHRALAAERDISYSAVKTIVDRLEQKGALRRKTSVGRTIVYEPTFAESDLRQPAIKAFLKKMFGGEARPLMSHLLSDDSLSLDDLAYLERLLKERQKELDV